MNKVYSIMVSLKKALSNFDIKIDLLIFLVVGLFLVGWVQTANAGSVAPDTVITVTMKNFKFIPNNLQIPAGEKVRIKFQNKGSVTHAFMAGNDLTESLEGYQNGLFSGVEVTKITGQDTTRKTYGSNSLMLGVKPGQMATLTFTMPESKSGSYKFGCFKTTGTADTKHYKLGMKGTIKVGNPMSAHAK